MYQELHVVNRYIDVREAQCKKVKQSCWLGLNRFPADEKKQKKTFQGLKRKELKVNEKQIEATSTKSKTIGQTAKKFKQETEQTIRPPINSVDLTGQRYLNIAASHASFGCTTNTTS